MQRAPIAIISFVLSLATPSVVFSQDGLDSGGAPPQPRSAEGAPVPIDVVFTNIPGDPSADVPGHPGIHFGPGTGTTHFDRPYGSPNGNWILTADTDYPTTEDEVLLVNGVVVVREGTPAGWTGGAENVGLTDTQLGINDTGEFVFTNNTDGPTTTDDYIVLFSGGMFSAAAQEGQPIPVLPPATYDDVLESPVITSAGAVGFSADGIDGGPPTTQDDILLLGASLLAQEGVTVPPGQIGAEFWENFDISDFHISSDGAHWLVNGDLTGSTTTDDVVAVDGTVVVQEGVILAGSGFAEPVDASGIVGVHMDPDGNWFVRGNNDTTEQDWIYSNGAVLTTLGQAIYAGSPESWTDAEFSDCFFFHIGGAGGHYVIGGVSDGPTDSNGVLVLDNTHEVVRESDPVDLDGNGMFDDDVFFNTFGNDDGVLTDAGMLYFTATIKDGTGTVVGQGYFVADLSSLIGGGGEASIELTMTLAVDTDPMTDECGVSDMLTVGEGTPVEVCYSVENTGSVPLELHDLADSELGQILLGFPFTLAPGATVFLTSSLTATATTTFNGTWTAYNEGPSDVAESSDSATLTVVPPSIELTMTLAVDTDPMTDECGVSDMLTVDEGVAVEVCYAVENTGMTPLGLHDLVDTELGAILSGFPFVLNPGDSAFLTVSLEAMTTTTFNGTWTAYNEGPANVAQSSDSATLTVIPLPARATFAVTKAFDDGNPAQVPITINCNTGLPLQQSAMIAQGDGVTFVIVDFADGEMDCEVSEDVPDGYAPSYVASGDSNASDDDNGCQFTAVEHGDENACAITNTLLAVDVVVNKQWIDEHPEYQLPTLVNATLRCVNGDIVGGFACGNDECIEAYIDPGNPGLISVFPEWNGSTVCTATEDAESGVVQDESDCAAMALAPGQGAECTIVNTRLFAGIPVLSRHGLLVLALLMLGIGLVATRRLI